MFQWSLQIWYICCLKWCSILRKRLTSYSLLPKLYDIKITNWIYCPLPLEKKDFLLGRIKWNLTSPFVQQGIIIEVIKTEIIPLVSEQLELRFNGISESAQLLIFPCSQEKLIQEKQQECLDVKESVVIFIY